MYADAIDRLDACPVPDGDRQSEGFTELLRGLLLRHERAHSCLGRCLQGLARELRPGVDPALGELDACLQRFFAQRIGLQLLMGQHVAAAKVAPDGSVGLVHMEGSLAATAKRAARRTAVLCEVQMGRAPEIVVEEEAHEAVAFVPPHVGYALVEVLKNACRATLSAHAADSGEPLPSVACRIRHTPAWSTVQISDSGVGMSPVQLSNAWRFLHSTCKDEALACGAAALPRACLAGCGVGLPMSRLYARHFGGELRLSSREGLGTVAELSLPRLASLQAETPEQLVTPEVAAPSFSWPAKEPSEGAAAGALPLPRGGPSVLLPQFL